MRQVAAHGGAEGVSLLRTVQRDDVHAVGAADFFDDQAHGISICIARSAAPKVLPCASVRSETVPPPPRAPCNRKFSAPRLGSSKRSTGPSTKSPKCALTR